MTDRQQELREKAKHAVERALTEDGIAAWLRLRRNLHRFSFANQMLIVGQALEQDFEPTIVKAAWRWKRDGYHPAKGSRALHIWVFKSKRRKDGSWRCECGVSRQPSPCRECRAEDHYFQLGPVFDASQVVSFEDGTPPPRPTTDRSIDGDEMFELLGPLAEWAMAELDGVDTVRFEDLSHAAYDGYYNKAEELVVVDGSHPANQQFATLVHELCHAQGVGYDEYDRADAEAIVECAAYCVCTSAGLDVDLACGRYIAGWAGEDAAATLDKHAQTIDRIARVIENQVEALQAEAANHTEEAVPA